jgi:glycosyltransferase involved in cell wall biosynthesis
MRIAFVGNYFSEKMGYTENCLPKAWAALGHEVHVIVSNYQVYGDYPDFAQKYGAFLGDATTACGEKHLNGFLVHRLPRRQGRLIALEGLGRTLRSISPDVIQFHSCCSYDLLRTTAKPVRSPIPIFTEAHEHLSVTASWRTSRRATPRYRLYQIGLSLFAHPRTERCFAISPDCAEVAIGLHKVPSAKVVLMPLGTDTAHFAPVATTADITRRELWRSQSGYNVGDVVCIYTGKLDQSKNPLLLAKAVGSLRRRGLRVCGLFVGAGPQRPEIESIEGNRVMAFVEYSALPGYYQAGDIGVWPREESMAMLDAASCGLPVVVSDQIGEPDRVQGNGLMYREDDSESLASTLLALMEKGKRHGLGVTARQRMLEKYSWTSVANKRLGYYEEALMRKNSWGRAAGQASN